MFKKIGIPYNGPYELDTDNSFWKFRISMRKMGLMDVKVNVSNRMSTVKFNKKISVALNFDCQPPVLNIMNRSAEFFQPTQIKKTDMIVIDSETKLRCSGN